jgi:hypothetical protein
MPSALPPSVDFLRSLLRHDAAEARSQNSFEQIVSFVVQRLRDAARVAPREGAEQVKQGFSALGLVNTTRCASWHPRGVDRSLRQVRDCPKGDGKRNRGLE